MTNSLTVALALAVSLGLVVVTGCSRSSGPAYEGTIQVPGSVYDYRLKTIDGKPQSLGEHRGKVLLIVNVASNCGFTPQYEGLQKLHEQYADDGLVVMGIPSNDFFGQEPGSEQEIKSFCTSKYDVTFPMYSKVKVKGEGQDPLYEWLTAQGGKVTWNFNKFLVGRDGKTIRHFESKVTPDDLELRGAITGALAEQSSSSAPSK